MREPVLLCMRGGKFFVRATACGAKAHELNQLKNRKTRGCTKVVCQQCAQASKPRAIIALRCNNPFLRNISARSCHVVGTRQVNISPFTFSNATVLLGEECVEKFWFGCQWKEWSPWFCCLLDMCSGVMSFNSFFQTGAGLAQKKCGRGMGWDGLRAGAG